MTGSDLGGLGRLLVLFPIGAAVLMIAVIMLVGKERLFPAEDADQAEPATSGEAGDEESAERTTAARAAINLDLSVNATGSSISHVHPEAAKQTGG